MNLDVLDLIFAELAESDLVACALVSRTFLAGVLPALYAHIEYTIRHVKRAHYIMSPFATLAAHHHLLVHVKRIAVHAAPMSSSTHNVSPPFLNDLAHALHTATNLRAFVCTVNILPPLLPHLIDKHRLRHLRIAASLCSRQIPHLQHISGLHSLSLDFPSWTVIDALPHWSASMQRTLAHLTLFMSQDLDATVLNATLAHLPRLRGLHVISCPRISHSIVLKALSHTPDLLELSLTVFPSQGNVLPQLNFSIPPLTHLSIDIRASYPALKPLIARIISRLSPRRALAICGGWIGEINHPSERIDPPQDTTGANGLDQPDDPPLLSSPHPHPPPNHNPGPPNQGHQPPPPIPVGFPFGFPLGNSNGNNNDPHAAGPPIPPPNPDLISDPSFPSLVASLPSTLSILHLPLLSPAALREVVERCEGIQVLGIVIGTTFTSPVSAKSSKTTGRSTTRSAARPKYATVSGIRQEVSLLASILSRARALRELIIDTNHTDIAGASSTATDPHGAFRGITLLTPHSVRMLMRESPLLRRVVGEGRVWESPTPTPSSPIHFPHCLPIDLTLSKARYGPGASNHHEYGPPGFGTTGGGYTQVEVENDHWFWLTGSASGGKVYSGF